MTLFVSFGFYGLSSVFVIIDRIASSLRADARPWVFLALNALALKQFKIMAWPTMGSLLLLLSLAYFTTRDLKRIESSSFRGILYSMFGLFLYWRLVEKASPIELIGLSYVFVKLAHYMVDQHKGRIAGASWNSFLSYFLFFPSYTSGPIARFQDFDRDLRNPQPITGGVAIEAIDRIAMGLGKKLVLVPIFSLFALTSQNASETRLRYFPLALVAYSGLIYFDFSGYSDIAIGMGRFFGIRLPENFNAPYSRKNLIEFWNAWHISLSQWLRDYVFLPVGQALFRNKNLKKQPWAVAALAYLITFLFCGIWHGGRWNFAIWGLYHGMGLAVCKVFIDRRKRSGARGTRVGATALTFGFVTFGWLFFVLSPEALLAVLKRVAQS